jgi:hypothetical protein
MGLIINDTLTLDNGLPLTGGYLSFNGGQVVNVEYGVSCGLSSCNTFSNHKGPNTDTYSHSPLFIRKNKTVQKHNRLLNIKL